MPRDRFPSRFPFSDIVAWVEAFLLKDPFVLMDPEKQQNRFENAATRDLNESTIAKDRTKRDIPLDDHALSPGAQSGARRAPIPIHRGQSFRFIAGSDSCGSRAVGEGM